MESFSPAVVRLDDRAVLQRALDRYIKHGPGCASSRKRDAGHTIEADDIGLGGISAYITKGTTIWSNRVSGRVANGIGIWSGTRASLLANYVEDFVAARPLIDLADLVGRTAVPTGRRQE